MKLYEHLKKVFCHKALKFQLWFTEKLAIVDALPYSVKKPLGVILLLIWIIFFYVPFLNWIILIFVGARMLQKQLFPKIYNFFFQQKKFYSLREELLYTLAEL